MKKEIKDDTKRRIRTPLNTTVEPTTLEALDKYSKIFNQKKRGARGKMIDRMVQFFDLVHQDHPHPQFATGTIQSLEEKFQEREKEGVSFEAPIEAAEHIDFEAEPEVKNKKTVVSNNKTYVLNF